MASPYLGLATSVPLPLRNRPPELDPCYRPLFPRASQTSRNMCRIFIRCFAATAGIGMLVCFFVLRYAYHYPEMEDNFTMIWCCFVALFIIGFFFLLTHEDGEAYA